MERRSGLLKRFRGKGILESSRAGRRAGVELLTLLLSPCPPAHAVLHATAVAELPHQRYSLCHV